MPVCLHNYDLPAMLPLEVPRPDEKYLRSLHANTIILHGTAGSEYEYGVTTRTRNTALPGLALPCPDLPSVSLFCPVKPSLTKLSPAQTRAAQPRPEQPSPAIAAPGTHLSLSTQLELAAINPT
ncbi:hypothetical protein E2C01_031883 [Portunus trituberculatus]|uniref:Uncharacterized protein n=1 Tax=Portunus trituberculatus TaxID=210409 RepID=A0A5B7EYU9_PORTR|nr:hypothetical protein [Portunus trituberculatus]